MHASDRLIDLQEHLPSMWRPLRGLLLKKLNAGALLCATSVVLRVSVVKIPHEEIYHRGHRDRTEKHGGSSYWSERARIDLAASSDACLRAASFVELLA